MYVINGPAFYTAAHPPQGVRASSPPETPPPRPRIAPPAPQEAPPAPREPPAAPQEPSPAPQEAPPAPQEPPPAPQEAPPAPQEAPPAPQEAPPVPPEAPAVFLERSPRTGRNGRERLESGNWTAEAAEEPKERRGSPLRLGRAGREGERGREKSGLGAGRQRVQGLGSGCPVSYARALPTRPGADGKSERHVDQRATANRVSRRRLTPSRRISHSQST